MKHFLLFLLLSCFHVYSQNEKCKEGGGNICLESSSFNAKDQIRVFFPAGFFNVDPATRFILKIYNGDLTLDPNSDLCNPSRGGVNLVPLQQWTIPANPPPVLPGYTLGYTDVNVNTEDPVIAEALKVDPHFFFQVSADSRGGPQCLLGPLNPFTHISLVLSSVIPDSSTSTASSDLPSDTTSVSTTTSRDLTQEQLVGIIVAAVLILLSLLILLIFIILQKRTNDKKKFDTVQSTKIKKRVSFLPDSTVISTTSSIDSLFPFADNSSSSLPSPNILPPTENPFDDPAIQNPHDSALLIAESYRKALNNPDEAGPLSGESQSPGSRKSQTFGELLEEI